VREGALLRWYLLGVFVDVTLRTRSPTYRRWQRASSRRRESRRASTQVLLRVATASILVLFVELRRRSLERGLSNRGEARDLLAEQVESARRRPYAEHAAELPARGRWGGFLPPEREETRELRGSSGTGYELRVRTGWVGKPGGPVKLEFYLVEEGFRGALGASVRLAAGGSPVST
jgi:hypothetical protein